VTTLDGEAVKFGAGDLVTFPRGLKCSWEVRKPIGAAAERPPQLVRALRHQGRPRKLTIGSYSLAAAREAARAALEQVAKGEDPARRQGGEGACYELPDGRRAVYAREDDVPVVRIRFDGEIGEPLIVVPGAILSAADAVAYGKGSLTPRPRLADSPGTRSAVAAELVAHLLGAGSGVPAAGGVMLTRSCLECDVSRWKQHSGGVARRLAPAGEILVFE
jgi:hypothetical protein